MEHPEMIRGEDAAFSVHLTDLATYRPLGEGTATLDFELGGKIASFASKAPARPGIFRVDVRLDAAGDYRAVLRVKAPDLEDRHDLGRMTVYESKSAAIAGSKPAPAAEAIRFLKEQQWASEFATQKAAPRAIEETFQVPAIVQVRGGGEGSAISPIKGRLSPAHQIPIPGKRVRRGDLIAAVAPFTASPQDLTGLKLDLTQAETDLAQARRVRERLEALLADRAIPARRVEEARTDEEKAQARLQAAKDRLTQVKDSWSAADGDDRIVGSFKILAPLSES
jgi:cobalt-zinc-cadmium efflux system membrane fusion protein